MKFQLNVVCFFLDVFFSFSLSFSSSNIQFIRRFVLYNEILHDCVSFFLDMMEDKNSHGQDNISDDLDFYDFLEVVSDKFDTITQQSNVEWIFIGKRICFSFYVIVEERKEVSRQRWEKTKNDVDEQKRLLQIELQNRVRLLSDSLRKPSFIRIRDKIIFTLGVANACFTPLIGKIISYY